MSVNFILFYSYLFLYFMQGRSENHFCENAPCLTIIIIIIIIIKRRGFQQNVFRCIKKWPALVLRYSLLIKRFKPRGMLDWLAQ